MAMSEENSAARVCRGLSRPSILLGVAALLVCVGFIVAPDRIGGGEALVSSLGGPSGHAAWDEYEYGWPWVWMRRLPLRDDWSLPIWKNVDEFRWEWLLLDTLSALLVGCGIAVAFEVRVRRGTLWYQITIREALVVVALAACTASYLTSQKRQWNVEVEIDEQLWSEGEHFVTQEYAGPAVLKRPIRLLGCPLFDRVTEVELSDATDDSGLVSLMPRLSALQHLRALSLRSTDVSDRGVCGLAALHCIEVLSLASTDISDEALRCVSTKLPRLKSLYLGSTKVSDNGLIHLLELRSLNSLGLAYTEIGDEGLQVLGELPNIQTLDLEGTKITDKALSTLANCNELRELELGGTDVTPEGIAQLKRALPGCKVIH